MDQKTFNRWRYIRMVLWALAMATTASIVGMYSPRKAVFVPCFFLCIMVPAVLLPLKPVTESKPKD
jgi:hypothetical protein